MLDDFLLPKNLFVYTRDLPISKKILFNHSADTDDNEDGQDLHSQHHGGVVVWFLQENPNGKLVRWFAKVLRFMVVGVMGDAHTTAHLL